MSITKAEIEQSFIFSEGTGYRAPDAKITDEKAWEIGAEAKLWQERAALIGDSDHVELVSRKKDPREKGWRK